MKRTYSTRGAAIVEAAIVISLLILMFIPFWDLMMVALSHVRHQSAAVQIALTFKDPALYATIDNSGAVPTISVAQLTQNQLTDNSSNPPTGFLPKLNLLFNNIMENIGTYSDKVDHNQASALWYLSICRGGEPQCATKLPGSAYAKQASNGVRAYPGPALPGDECFGSYDVKTELTKYANAELDFILAGSPTGSGYPPFGTQTINSPQLQVAGQSIQITDYLPYKPIVFWASCSRPPRFFSSSPVVTFHTFFVDKEMAYQSN